MNELYIKVNDRDNVAIIVKEGGAKEGCTFEGGLVAKEDIPQAHKIALSDIPAGSEVLRYGEVIGHAKEDIKKGCWVNERNVKIREAVPVESLKSTFDHKWTPPEVGDRTFMGYRNTDGTFGTRNILAITTTVQCVEGVVNVAVDRIRRELLPKYPNVDDVAALNHAYGCGVAISARNSRNPNQDHTQHVKEPKLRRRAAYSIPWMREAYPAEAVHGDRRQESCGPPGLQRLPGNNGRDNGQG